MLLCVSLTQTKRVNPGGCSVVSVPVFSYRIIRVPFSRDRVTDPFLPYSSSLTEDRSVCARPFDMVDVDEAVLVALEEQ